MKIRLEKLSMENFAGIKDLSINFFGHNATVWGRNATGKSTLLNAITYLMFGTNAAGETKFAKRPIDSTGEYVHDVDVYVGATLLADDEEIILEKFDREKWVKKRGTETAQFMGNETQYKINGYPRKETEYKAFISNLITDEIFKVLTDPMRFSALPWKKQREILMMFVTHITDEELAKKLGGFEELLPELKSAPSLDAIDKKFRGEAKMLSDRQKELPIRIDELTAQIAEGNIDQLKKSKAFLENVLAKVKELEAERTAVISDGQREKLERSSVLHKEYDSVWKQRNAVTNELRDYEAQVRDIEWNGKRNSTDLRELNDELAHMSKATKKICPTCGQAMPTDDSFIAERKIEMARLDKQITELSNRIKTDKAKQDELAKKIDNAKRAKDALDAKEQRINKAIADLSAEPLPAETTAKVDEIDKQLAEYADYDTAYDDIRKIEGRIALLERNDAVKARISELRSELKTVAQQIADNEKMLYLLGKFIEAKMTEVSRAVNENFEGISFKLFENQINGGVKETCELTVNGVPYSDLNSSDRILAGLNVIKALQRLYNTEAFIFIDNAESINDDRIPKMPNQMVLLKVSEDPKLRIEVE